MRYSPSNEVYDSHIELYHFKQSTDKLDFVNIKQLSSAMIVPRESKLNVSFDHRQPALVGEWYEVKVNLLNDELFDISNLKVEVSLEEETNEGKNISRYLCNSLCMVFLVSCLS